jgi:T-complex protein 1 subunit delta
MIQDSKGHVLITNDGATILKQMEVVHPTAKMVHFLIKLFAPKKLVEISKA